MIDSEEFRIKALKWTAIGDVWGIGRQHAKRLLQQGVATAYDITQMPDELVKKHFSVVGLRLKQELLGNAVLDLELLNKRIGSNNVKLASQDLGRTWKMKQERLSPCYTTRLTDIIIIKA